MPEDISKQIANVLRLSKGDKIVVLDNSGVEYLVELDQLIKKAVAGRIVSRTTNGNEPSIKITLYQSLLPREKFEVVLQKGTEVGVCQFVPVETKRSLIKRSAFKNEKLERWQRIVTEASEQCERGIIPAVETVLNFEEAVEQAAGQGVVLLAYEREQSLELNQALDKIKDVENIAVMIGPEGGFEEGELEYARNKGVFLVSLGPRILRSETAGIVAPALILAELTRSN